jgi:outer membrane lipoprotein LolB
VPVSALFAWLMGRDLHADGWEVDLRQFTQGKIVAERLAPLPKAQLRVILEP